MGKLITVVGNSGVGKTTLVRRLCAMLPCLQPALEQHEQRPFQQLFAGELTRYALANQVDYLLLRGEQERAARAAEGASIHDGGLDLDFHGFARLFHRKGYLTEAEFGLCERLYTVLRACLPPPELIIYLDAPASVVARRYRRRRRGLETTQLEDLALLDDYVRTWVQSLPPQRLLLVDAAASDYGSEGCVATIAAAVRLVAGR